MSMHILGIGVPMRQPSYILGRPTDFQTGKNELSIASQADNASSFDHLSNPGVVEDLN